MRAVRAKYGALPVLALLASFLVAPISNVNAESATSKSASEETSDTEDTWRRNEPMHQAAELLKREADTNQDGFAGIQIVPETSVILWWKGDLPSALQAAVAEARRITPVEVRAAAYTERELEVAAEKIDASTSLSSPIHTIEIPVDGSHLRVLVEPGGEAAARVAALPDVGVPVVHQLSPRPELTTRCDDASPWKGGGGIRNTTLDSTGPACLGQASKWLTCTAGFAVADGSTEFLLTARHCGRVGDSFADASGQNIGVASRGNKSQDIMLITANTDGVMFDGTTDSNSVTDVAGWRNTFAGDYLITSGAVSGNQGVWTVTGYRTFEHTVTFPLELTPTEVYGLSTATWCNGVRAEGGDSGGPVFQRNAGAGTVVASGIIHGRRNGQTCPTLVFMDFGRIRAATGFNNVVPL